MRAFRVGGLLATGVFLLLLLPALGYAQEANIGGTITDTTGGVLPGVTITAVHDATGNTFMAVTDERGGFRLPVRTGMHTLTVELPGFATLSRRVDLLVNQQAVVNLTMTPSTVQETVTVTGEAPLIDTASSTISGNIDPRQMQDIPINGRNWLDLAMLAPGSRQNASSDTLGGQDYQFQINIDGQQVTQVIAGGFGQPRYSREAIAEFELVTNRFDATQGRSSGSQLNAITKSGTNTPQGTFSGYFRDDNFNAKDFFQDRVLPYTNQQLAWTFGGPIRRDRVHFFATYEYEREPMTFNYTSPYPSFNMDQPSTRTENKGSVRLDVQFSPRLRLAVRGNKAKNLFPIDNRFSGGATRHPSSAIETARNTNHLQGTLTQVVSNSIVNELRAGYAGFDFYQYPAVKWPNHPYPQYRTWGGSPIIQFRGGYTIGQGHANSPVRPIQDPYTVRDDLMFAYNAGGRHNVKTGVEYMYMKQSVSLCDFCMGTYDVQGGPVPANIEQLFPVWNDVNSWNLAALSPITRFVRIGVGNQTARPIRHALGAWWQDDWSLGRLTLNLGVRYDVASSTLDSIPLAPFLEANRAADKNNIAPRLGFAYSLNDATVLRGGFGKYFAQENENTVFWSLISLQTIGMQIFNDGRPDFAANPFNGPVPTFDEALALHERGLLRRTAREIPSPDRQTQYSYQASLGIQRQLGSLMAVEADWVYISNYALEITGDINRAYNLETGINYPFSDPTKRPYAGWDSVGMNMTRGKDRVHALQASVTKRLGNRWQAAASYSMTFQRNFQHTPAPPGCDYVWTISATGQFQCNVPITLHPTLRDEWYLSPDQRHRATFNAIWEAPFGLQVSGLYFFGDNGWITPASGVDALQIGSTGNLGAGSNSRVRANGALAERNGFDRPSLHRVDMRLQRRVRMGTHVTLDGMVEAFNLFNHRNYNSFITNESNARFGEAQPDNTALAFQPRMLQFGFRLAF